MTTGGCFRRARASAGARRDEPAPFLPGAQEQVAVFEVLNQFGVFGRTDAGVKALLDHFLVEGFEQH